MIASAVAGILESSIAGGGSIFRLVQIIEVTPSDEIDAASWIAPRLRPFNTYCTGSIVPGGFEAYARVNHQREGVLPEETAAAMVAVLVRHTTTPDVCWMALWHGYGTVDSDPKPRSLAQFTATASGAAPPEPAEVRYLRIPPQRPRSTPRLRLPQRDYVLYTGSPRLVPGWLDGPNLWWPDDRAWCVASEIDLPWTYVGGSEALISELLENQPDAARRTNLDESWVQRPADV